MPSTNGPFLSPSCPYSVRYRPSGREHTYDLCEATGEVPLAPSQTELAELCHGEFTRCPHFIAARKRETSDREAAERRDDGDKQAA